MNSLHHFDEAGYYTGTTEVPMNPVTGKPLRSTRPLQRSTHCLRMCQKWSVRAGLTVPG